MNWKWYIGAVLHRPGMPLVDQCFNYTWPSTSKRKALKFLQSEKPTMPSLACQFIIIMLSETLLLSQVSQKAQMNLNFSTSSCMSFFSALWIRSTLWSTLGQIVFFSFQSWCQNQCLLLLMGRVANRVCQQPKQYGEDIKTLQEDSELVIIVLDRNLQNLDCIYNSTSEFLCEHEQDMPVVFR